MRVLKVNHGDSVNMRNLGSKSLKRAIKNGGLSVIFEQ